MVIIPETSTDWLSPPLGLITGWRRLLTLNVNLFGRFGGVWGLMPRFQLNQCCILYIQIYCRLTQYVITFFLWRVCVIPSDESFAGLIWSDRFGLRVTFCSSGPELRGSGPSRVLDRNVWMPAPKWGIFLFLLFLSFLVALAEAFSLLCSGDGYRK